LRLAIVCLMVASSLTLFVASAIHFGVAIPRGAGTIRDPFAGAAAPEAVLGVIQGAGAITLGLQLPRARAIAMGTTIFTALVVVYGLTITARGGRTGDIVYHLCLLIALLVTTSLLLRTRSTSRGRESATAAR
jgi:hypothetical protein